jgi:hypothetical protein
MLNLRNVLSAVLAALLSGTSLAQSNIGELRDAGARLLGMSEVVALLRDTTWEATGNPIHTEYHADGSFTEFVQITTGLRQGQGKGHFGTWSVDTTGKECEIRKNSKGEVRCHYWFSLGASFFIAEDPEDRNERVGKRQLKK